MYACLFAREASDHVLQEIVESFSPLFTIPGPDLALLDLRGMHKLFGTFRQIADAIQQRAFLAGVTGNVAVASNMDTAIAVAKGFPGITIIASGEEGKTLAPLPIALLSPSDPVKETLLCWGIRSMGELAALPEKGVAERLGPEGLYLQKLARGWVRRPLIPHRDRLTFEDSIELEHPLELLEPLSFLLSRLLNELCGRLAENALATNRIELRLELEEAAEYVRELNLPFAGSDPASFLKLLQYDLAAHPPEAPIRKVTLKLTPVAPRRLQNGLFLPLAPEAEKLELTLARATAIVGEGNIGSPEVLNTHRPDAFRIVKFDANCKAEPASTGPPQLAVRRFRPPLPARVDASSGRPRKIVASGIGGKIVTCSGPWRSSGDWWKPDPWARDEWDIALENGGLYRIYCEPTGSWFVDANYD